MCGGSILSCCPHNPHENERALKEEEDIMHIIQLKYRILYEDDIVVLILFSKNGDLLKLAQNKFNDILQWNIVNK